MSSGREIQAAVELLREHGLFALRQEDLGKLVEALPHMGGDVSALRALLTDASDRAMYQTIAEQLNGVTPSGADSA
jgi:hypothetical protein